MCLEATQQRVCHNMLLTPSFWRKDSALWAIACRQIQSSATFEFWNPQLTKVDLTYFFENVADFFGWKVHFLRTVLRLFWQVSPSQRHQEAKQKTKAQTKLLSRGQGRGRVRRGGWERGRANPKIVYSIPKNKSKKTENQKAQEDRNARDGENKL